MHDPEKSDSGRVAAKPTNKAGRPVAEPVEPRPGTKGNADQQSTHRTQSRVRVTQALDRVRQGPTCALTSNTRGRSRMPKSGLSGSVRGAPSNGRPYRDTLSKPHMGVFGSSGQVHRHIKKLRLLFRYPRSEPYFMTWLVPHQIKLTSGRHSKQLHQYPAFGGWGSGGRDHSFTRLFKPVHCSVPIAWIRQDRLGPGDWGIVLERLRSDGLHRGALDDDAAG